MKLTAEELLSLVCQVLLKQMEIEHDEDAYAAMGYAVDLLQDTNYLMNRASVLGVEYHRSTP